jgi:hypothetical protein
MLIGSGLQALTTSDKFKPLILGQIQAAGDKAGTATGHVHNLPAVDTEAGFAERGVELLGAAECLTLKEQSSDLFCSARGSSWPISSVSHFGLRPLLVEPDIAAGTG